MAKKNDPWKEILERAFEPLSVHQRLTEIEVLIDMAIGMGMDTNFADRVEFRKRCSAVIHAHLDAVAQGRGCEEYKRK